MYVWIYIYIYVYGVPVRGLHSHRISRPAAFAGRPTRRARDRLPIIMCVCVCVCIYIYIYTHILNIHWITLTCIRETEYWIRYTLNLLNCTLTLCYIKWEVGGVRLETYYVLFFIYSFIYIWYIYIYIWYIYIYILIHNYSIYSIHIHIYTYIYIYIYDYINLIECLRLRQHDYYKAQGGTVSSNSIFQAAYAFNGTVSFQSFMFVFAA